MFRARTNPVGLLVLKVRPLKRAYATGFQPLSPRVRVRVRLLGPTLWSVAACSTIYLGCAAFEVYQDARRAKEKTTQWIRKGTAPTFEDLQSLRDRASANARSNRISGPESPEFLAPGELTRSIMAVTAAVHLASNFFPTMKYHFAHTPALSPNYTLLTSVFGHGGLLHLGFNLYGMYILMPRAERSPTLEGSSAHLAAFYASAGILSSLASQVTAVWPGGTAYTAGLGASGALFALLGIVGVSYPTAQVGIVFLPGSIPITEAMVYLALFDAIGIFVRYPYLRLGHAPHLAGLALGYTYAKQNGGKNIWRPGRKVAFKAMRSIGVI
ncbi:hypothetical protein EV127DRAFT_194762 [Xylaria flabelliformis]|nr:hypothetical protein EV127DRAFT_194762 [Xylaria flabelliformis]